jgi:hypothetical protein
MVAVGVGSRVGVMVGVNVTQFVGYSVGVGVLGSVVFVGVGDSFMFTVGGQNSRVNGAECTKKMLLP